MEKTINDTSSNLPPGVFDGEHLLYRGKRFKVMIKPIEGEQVSVERKRGIEIRKPKAAAEEDIHQALKQWLRADLESHIIQFLQELSTEIPIQPTAVQVLDLENEWFRCGVSRTLYFDWRLTVAPPKVIEYAITHNLHHIVIRSHSDQFWEGLSKAIGDPGEHKKWLEDNLEVLGISKSGPRSRTSNECRLFFDSLAINPESECPELTFEDVKLRQRSMSNSSSPGRGHSASTLSEEAQLFLHELRRERSVPTRYRKYFEAMYEWTGLFPLVSDFVQCTHGYEQKSKMRCVQNIKDLASRIRFEANRALRGGELPYGGTLKSPLLRPIDFVPWLAQLFPLEQRSWVADLVLLFTICKKEEEKGPIEAEQSYLGDTPIAHDSPANSDSLSIPPREAKMGRRVTNDPKADSKAVNIWKAHRGEYRSYQDLVDDSPEGLPEHIRSGSDLRKAIERVRKRDARAE